MNETREEVRCEHCELNQFRPQTGKCRRCGKRILGRGLIVSTHVIYVPVAVEPPPVPHEASVKPVTLREVMRMAAVHAVEYYGYTTKAAKALDIPHERLRQLLKEAGGEHGRDRRYDKSQQKQKGE